MYVRVVSATDAKNEFGGLLEAAISGVTVFIRKYDKPKAVLMSIQAYDELSARGPALEEMSARYDAWLQRMQTPEARQRMLDAFHAKPEEMGRAAVRRAASVRQAAGVAASSKRGKRPAN